MVNLALVHSFLKDPLTDKLVNRYVESPKARKAIETSIHVVEILMVAMPLINSAVKGVKDMFKSSRVSREGAREGAREGEGRSTGRGRRALPAAQNGTYMRGSAA